MKTINRTVITIIPKQPYINWANSFGDDGPKMSMNSIHATSLLIPEKYDEFTYEQFLKKNYKIIFEEELASWITDPDTWPSKMDYNTFTQWFHIIVSDTVLDLGKEPIAAEEF
jgi:hypothetical protein